MANFYTTPNTFVDGDPLDAAKLNENITALQEAAAQGIDNANILDASSISTSKILRPRYTPIGLDTQSVYTQSGSIHVINHPLVFWSGKTPLQQVPYQTRGYITNVTSPVGSGTTAFQPVPQSWISFYADKTPVAVIARTTMQVIIPTDGTGTVATNNRFHFRLVDASNVSHDYLGSTCRVREMDTDPITDMRLAATQVLSTDAEQGWNHIGLVYGLDSNFGLLAGMTLTVEVFY